jgi:hypothetical protein
MFSFLKAKQQPLAHHWLEANYVQENGHLIALYYGL